MSLYTLILLCGKVAVSWLKIVGLGLGLGLAILSHETATLPFYTIIIMLYMLFL